MEISARSQIASFGGPAVRPDAGIFRSKDGAAVGGNERLLL
jgi:hypothetical protein